MTEERANTLATRPWYLPRSEGGNRSPITMKVLAMIIPAPIPWNPLKAMSCPIVWLKPDRSEPSVNTATPAM